VIALTGFIFGLVAAGNLLAFLHAWRRFRARRWRFDTLNWFGPAAWLGLCALAGICCAVYRVDVQEDLNDKLFLVRAGWTGYAGQLLFLLSLGATLIIFPLALSVGVIFGGNYSRGSMAAWVAFGSYAYGALIHGLGLFGLVVASLAYEVALTRFCLGGQPTDWAAAGFGLGLGILKWVGTVALARELTLAGFSPFVGASAAAMEQRRGSVLLGAILTVNGAVLALTWLIGWGDLGRLQIPAACVAFGLGALFLVVGVRSTLARSAGTDAASGLPLRCPCCGNKTLRQRGAFQICQVCFWEDDGQDDHDADVVRGGRNGQLSLTQARANYQRLGAYDERFVRDVRPPRSDELPVEQHAAPGTSLGGDGAIR
jgi:hypothetical protein